MRADVFLRRLQAGLFEGAAQDGIQDLGVPERPVRDLAGDKQNPRLPVTSVSDVFNDGLSDIRRQRHTIVQPPLAPDQDFASSPVEVLKPDGDHLWRSQPEASHEQQHRVVAAANGIVRADCLDQTVNLVRSKVTGQVRRLRLHHARHAVGQVARRLAAPEQELEQVAEMRGRRLVAIRARSGLELTQESNNVLRGLRSGRRAFPRSERP